MGKRIAALGAVLWMNVAAPVAAQCDTSFDPLGLERCVVLQETTDEGRTKDLPHREKPGATIDQFSTIWVRFDRKAIEVQLMHCLSKSSELNGAGWILPSPDSHDSLLPSVCVWLDVQLLKGGSNSNSIFDSIGGQLQNQIDLLTKAREDTSKNGLLKTTLETEPSKKDSNLAQYQAKISDMDKRIENLRLALDRMERAGQLPTVHYPPMLLGHLGLKRSSADITEVSALALADYSVPLSLLPGVRAEDTLLVSVVDSLLGVERAVSWRLIVKDVAFHTKAVVTAISCAREGSPVTVQNEGIPSPGVSLEMSGQWRLHGLQFLDPSFGLNVSAVRFDEGSEEKTGLGIGVYFGVLNDRIQATAGINTSAKHAMGYFGLGLGFLDVTQLVWGHKPQ